MKIKDWMRWLTATVLALGLAVFILKDVAKVICYGDGLSQTKRDRVLAAYFERLNRGKVKRPLSRVEYDGSEYSAANYRPMIKIMGDTLTVQVDRNMVAYYRISPVPRDSSSSQRDYTFTEFRLQDKN